MHLHLSALLHVLDLGPPVLKPDLDGSLAHPQALRELFAQFGIRTHVGRESVFEDRELLGRGACPLATLDGCLAFHAIFRMLLLPGGLRVWLLLWLFL